MTRVLLKYAGRATGLGVLAGPAVVSVKHDVPGSVSVTEAAGGPAVAVSVDRVSKSFTGYQVGVDLRYLITEQIGVGGFVRYAGAGGTLDGAGDLDLGGAQIGVGVRLRY